MSTLQPTIPHGKPGFLSQSLNSSLLPDLPTERFVAGRAILWEGDPSSDVFYLVGGTLRYCRVLLDGRRMISSFALPGEFFGLSSMGRYLFTIEAVSDCRIQRLSTGRMKVLASRAPHVHGAIVDALRVQYYQMHTRLLSMLHKSAEERVAHFVLDIGQRTTGDLDNGSVFCLSMPRSDIADHLGLTVETVCRALTRLKRDGVLKLDRPNRVIINDLAALCARAAEDPTTGDLGASGSPARRGDWRREALSRPRPSLIRKTTKLKSHPN
ncbi:helix-turn-helix domain-containing protein [Chelativorans sp. Marseille-P2723]|uniref:Crp/Fnr family transcriptional regulator n=1 Tax=Chelativorans sp. Marseille-P2723 TaxID=2709133 RepID=UPI0015705E4C|nr:helix-turn-helix domain-containing protein [Chelativorans sp. Marseille-P2723]